MAKTHIESWFDHGRKNCRIATNPSRFMNTVTFYTYFRTKVFNATAPEVTLWCYTTGGRRSGKSGQCKRSGLVECDISGRAEFARVKRRLLDKLCEKWQKYKGDMHPNGTGFETETLDKSVFGELESVGGSCWMVHTLWSTNKQGFYSNMRLWFAKV